MKTVQHVTSQLMFNTPLRILLAFITLLAFATCHDDALEPADTPADDCITTSSVNTGDVIPEEYIVSFDTVTKQSDIVGRVLADHRIASAKVIERIGVKSPHYLMKLSKKEASALGGDEAVARIEPDRIISLCACFTVLAPNLVTWNVGKTGYGNGTGKTAWIMDTGIDFDHPDLNVDEHRSRTFITGETSADDDNGHGTHIAGIIGAKNNTLGVLGIASGATLVSLKILDHEGSGRLSTALKALSYAKAGAAPGDVVNISLSVENVSQILDDEIQAIARKGIFITIAAGNESQPANTFSPARTSGINIYTISAVDSLDHFASFSNYGNDVVDFAAPGVRILSTYRDGKYAIMSGTSMAAPHVAGLLLINNGRINTRGYALNDPDDVADPIAQK